MNLIEIYNKISKTSKLLDLTELYKKSVSERNRIVLDMNEFVISNHTFGDEYGWLCGESSGGILIEDSLESLFDISGISINYLNNGAILIQNEKTYWVPTIYNRAGSYERSLHLDFQGMIRYK